MAEKTIDLVSKEYEANSIKEVYSHLGKVGAKNLLEITADTTTTNEITFTVDKAAGTVFIAGGQTSTANIYLPIGSMDFDGLYTLSGCPAGGAYSKFLLALQQSIIEDFGEGGTGKVNGTYKVYIVIYSGCTIPSEGLLFKPMIRYAEDPDNTFAPFAKTNLELTHLTNSLKNNTGKNVLKITSGSLNAFSVNSPQKGMVTVNGQYGQNYFFSLWKSDKPISEYEKYKGKRLSGCPSGGNYNSYYWGLWFYDSAGTNITHYADYGDGVTLPNTAHEGAVTFGVYIALMKDYVANNIVFRPMIADTDADQTFEPYAKTNLELTEDISGSPGVGRNKLLITKPSGTSSGVNFVVDSPIKGAITASGTGGSSESWFFLTDELTFSEDMMLSGCPSGGSATTFELALSATDGLGALRDYGSGVKIPSGRKGKICIGIRASYTISGNLVFYPMLRDGDIVDPTYYPYSENEINFQSKLRPVVFGGVDADTNAAVHNANYRGQDITSLFNDGSIAQMLSDGSFEEIYPGDYFSVPIEAVADRWSARTFTCIVGVLNPMKYIGGNISITDNHIGFLTRENWFTSPWNSNGSTEGGYAGSEIHAKINDEVIIEAWRNALNGKGNLLQVEGLLSNAVNTDADSETYAGQKGKANGWGWRNYYFELLSEIQRYGSKVWSSGGYNTGAGNYQLPYFKYNIAERGNERRTWDWLRDIVSVSVAANANRCGTADCSTVTYAHYVRPLGFIKS